MSNDKGKLEGAARMLTNHERMHLGGRIGVVQWDTRSKERMIRMKAIAAVFIAEFLSRCAGPVHRVMQSHNRKNAIFGR